MNRKKDAPTPPEASGPVAYCGPTIPGAARQYTVYQNGIPGSLAEALADNPALRGLVLPLDRLPEARASLGKRSGPIYSLYLAALEKAQEKRKKEA